MVARGKAKPGLVGCPAPKILACWLKISPSRSGCRKRIVPRTPVLPGLGPATATNPSATSSELKAAT